MPTIRLKTCIKADIDLVFDLSRSIDLHQISTSHTNERVVEGRSSGLIELNESVTWMARHFGLIQKLTSKITAFEKPEYFVDEMVKGAFKSIRHEHLFAHRDGETIMTDVFFYVTPLGLLGKIADHFFLYNHMEDLLIRRNQVIKEYAENGKGADLI